MKVVHLIVGDDNAVQDAIETLGDKVCTGDLVVVDRTYYYLVTYQNYLGLGKTLAEELCTQHGVTLDG